MAENIKNDGLKYFKLDQDKYKGDETVKRGLAGIEIDNNFFFLRGKEIKEVRIEDVKKGEETEKVLVIELLDGTKHEFTLSGLAYKEELTELDTKLNNESSKLTNEDTELSNRISLYDKMTINDVNDEIKANITDITDSSGNVSSKEMNISLDDDFMFIAE